MREGVRGRRWKEGREETTQVEVGEREKGREGVEALRRAGERGGGMGRNGWKG